MSSLLTVSLLLPMLVFLVGFGFIFRGISKKDYDGELLVIGVFLIGFGLWLVVFLPPPPTGLKTGLNRPVFISLPVLNQRGFLRSKNPLLYYKFPIS